MPVYQFSAASPDGKQESGLLHAASFEAAAAQLASQGLTVQNLSAAQSAGDPIPEEAARIPEAPGIPTPPPTTERSRIVTEVVGPLVQPVSLSVVQFFFRQLGTMLHAGVPTVQALETLAGQSRNPIFSKIVLELRDHVSAGRPISVGLQRYPEVFSPVVMSLVRAGEEGGFLSDQCTLISDYLQRDIELKNMIRRETAYPKLVFVFSVIIILAANAVITAVAPGKQGIVPPVMIWMSVAVLAVGGFLFARVGLKNPRIKFGWDTLLLGIPWIGGMVKGFAMARFGRAFGALYKGGVPYSRALSFAADVCGNEALRARMHPAAARLEQGYGITQTFAETQAFSPLVLDMTKTGEMTGNMDQMLIKVAEYYEDEGQTKARASATLLGVLAIVFIGVYVAYIVVTFYSGYGQGLSDQARDAGSMLWLTITKS